MKFRQTIQLGATLVLLVLIYLGFQILGRQSEQQVEEAKRLFGFSADEVRVITIHQLDRPPTTGERKEDGAWSITEPNSSIPPFEPLWDRVADQFATLKSERTLPETARDEEAYGLSVPRFTVTADAGGQIHKLRFGYLDPTQSYRYASLDDGVVFLVDKDAAFELDRPLDLLRDSFVLDNTESPLIRMEFARYLTEEDAKGMNNPPPLGTESFVLVLERQNAESPWEQVTPIRVAANGERVNALADELRGARGRGHVDNPESLSDYGLDPGTARLTVMDADEGRAQTLYFGDVSDAGEKGGVYVREDGKPGVFLMDGHILTLFPRNTNAFRERRLLSQLKSPTRIERVDSNEDYVLELTEGGEWHMTTPPLDDTDPLYVHQFVNALKMLEGVRFYPGTPSDYGLDNPEATFLFTLEDGATPLEIRLAPSPEVDGHYYVLTDAGEVASLPAEHVKFLLNGPQSFRDRTLLRFDRSRATRVELTFGDVNYILEKQHDRWLVVAPEGYYMPNQRDAMELLGAVVGLRTVGAEESVAEAETEYGFSNPRIALTVTVAPANGVERPDVVGPLLVGSVVPGLDQQRFARSASRDGVFRIPQTFVESVQTFAAGIQRRAAGAGTSN